MTETGSGRSGPRRIGLHRPDGHAERLGQERGGVALVGAGLDDPVDGERAGEAADDLPPHDLTVHRLARWRGRRRGSGSGRSEMGRDVAQREGTVPAGGHDPDVAGHEPQRGVDRAPGRTAPVPAIPVEDERPRALLAQEQPLHREGDGPVTGREDPEHGGGLGPSVPEDRDQLVLVVSLVDQHGEVGHLDPPIQVPTTAGEGLQGEQVDRGRDRHRPLELPPGQPAGSGPEAVVGLTAKVVGVGPPVHGELGVVEGGPDQRHPVPGAQGVIERHRLRLLPAVRQQGPHGRATAYPRGRGGRWRAPGRDR